MSEVVTAWPAIDAVIDSIDLQAEMARGFIEYSQGLCVVPPVGELLLEEDPPGEVHIKYGYVRGGDHYVVKIASGFPRNGALGLPTSNGMMILFNQRTGEVGRVLLEEGRLTDIRTAAAGALAASTLAPSRVEAVGIIGSGVQARLQLRHLDRVLPGQSVVIHGRTPEHVEACRHDLADLSLDIDTTSDPAELAARCNLIITTTSARTPLLKADWIRAGTCMVAIGSDTPEKQELDHEILAAADLVVCDSMEQCRIRGEVSQALRAGVISESDVVELGSILAGDAPGRSGDEQRIVVDLTGVAVQDLRIAEAVHHRVS